MKGYASYMLVALFIIPVLAAADTPGIPALALTTSVGGHQTYTVTIQVLLMMTLLAVLPSLLICMTSFTRIIVTLAILRQAIGLAQTPTNQILVGLSLFLTMFVMGPVFEECYATGIKPYVDEKIDTKQAFEKAQKPFKIFMLAQTREADIKLFADMGKIEKLENPNDVPFRVLLPAFLTSELKTAFQIGFLLFLPFLVIDIVIASVMMAMGMMMLSPMIVSLPFKIMLFVLIDGWTLVLGTLAASFGVR